ncbi:hypothetical protein C0Q70_00850 [Pomacea canaliculata]|uniref:Uncharacterized protein n=1 Tax=Pomacea canaliculata TaxID=400727 RepID=A0A2T7PXV2_POMCA|nr:hypothetical protein C0Q70_00850 [Pomacea canaliculata]
MDERSVLTNKLKSETDGGCLMCKGKQPVEPGICSSTKNDSLWDECCTYDDKAPHTTSFHDMYSVTKAIFEEDIFTKVKAQTLNVEVQYVHVCGMR